MTGLGPGLGHMASRGWDQWGPHGNWTGARRWATGPRPLMGVRRRGRARRRTQAGRRSSRRRSCTHNWNRSQWNWSRDSWGGMGGAISVKAEDGPGQGDECFLAAQRSLKAAKYPSMFFW